MQFLTAFTASSKPKYVPGNEALAVVARYPEIQGTAGNPLASHLAPYVLVSRTQGVLGNVPPRLFCRHIPQREMVLSRRTKEHTASGPTRTVTSL